MQKTLFVIIVTMMLLSFSIANAIDDPHGKMYFYDDEQKNIEAATNLNLSNLNIYKV